VNEVTVHGNVTADPVTHHNPTTGRVVVTFGLAVNSRRFNRERGEWVDRPTVFHHIVCFGVDLARNVAGTLRRGMTVTVTGQFADDSYQREDDGRRVSRIRLEAADVAVSLRWATAEVTRQPRPDGQPGASPDDATPAAETEHSAA
jgi:single-strand DNA-binding protein